MRILDREMRFCANECIAVLGGNGTGKTTLLRILSGIETKWEGHLEGVAGVDRIFVPTVPWNMLLPWYTGAENLVFFETRGRIRSGGKPSQAAINQYCRMLDFTDDYAHKALSRPVYQLSTGEAAVLTLICAVTMKPMMLLLDEIFANTSLRTSSRMVEELLCMNAECNMGVIIATHRPDVISKLSAKVVNLEEPEGG